MLLGLLLLGAARAAGASAAAAIAFLLLGLLALGVLALFGAPRKKCSGIMLTVRAPGGPGAFIRMAAGITTCWFQGARCQGWYRGRLARFKSLPGIPIELARFKSPVFQSSWLSNQQGWNSPAIMKFPGSQQYVGRLSSQWLPDSPEWPLRKQDST